MVSPTEILCIGQEGKYLISGIWEEASNKKQRTTCCEPVIKIEEEEEEECPRIGVFRRNVFVTADKWGENVIIAWVTAGKKRAV